MNYSFWKHGWFPVVWWGGATLVLLLNLPGSSTLEIVRNTMFWLVAVILPAGSFYKKNLANRGTQLTSLLGFFGRKEPIFLDKDAAYIINPWYKIDSKSYTTTDGINFETFQWKEYPDHRPESLTETGEMEISTSNHFMLVKVNIWLRVNPDELKEVIGTNPWEAMDYAYSSAREFLESEMKCKTSDQVHAEREEIKTLVTDQMISSGGIPGYLVEKVKVYYIKYPPKMQEARETAGEAQEIKRAAEKLRELNLDGTLSDNEALRRALALHGTIKEEVRTNIFDVGNKVDGTAKDIAAILARALIKGRRSKKRGR
ncbi:hypothetical protein L0Y41_00725 [bacterium]|nr:hypothetical protein [bacterium]